MSSGDAELSREERGVITRNKDVLFQKSGRAPGVAKDEWQLIVNKKGVVLSQWIINPRVALHRPQQGSSTAQSVATLEAFAGEEEALQRQIESVFGAEVLQEAVASAKAELDAST